jgi:hypothetical protein
MVVLNWQWRSRTNLGRSDSMDGPESFRGAEPGATAGYLPSHSHNSNLCPIHRDNFDVPSFENLLSGYFDCAVSPMYSTEDNHHPKHNEIPVVPPRPKITLGDRRLPGHRRPNTESQVLGGSPQRKPPFAGARSLGSLGAFAKRWIGVLCASRLELNGHLTVRSPQT